MFRSQQIESVPYPPPPWQLSGQSWVGLFRANHSLSLPAEYKSLLNSRYVVVAIIRYLSGTLQYDELIVASLVRRRARAGLFVHHIWVDDLSSLWGGRNIWGLQKEMAAFAWKHNVATISDAEGLIAQIEVNQDQARLPTLPLWMPSFGRVGEQTVFTVGRINARLGRAGMRVQDWSPRFGFRITTEPFLSVAGKPFEMIFRPPTFL